MLGLNLDCWLFCMPWAPGTRKLTWNLNGHLVGGREQRKNQQVKKKRDLNGLRYPSFPLHLVKEKMCHLDVFWLNLDWWPHFVSPYAPPGQALLHHVSPGCGRRTQRKPTWNLTSLTFGGSSSSKFTIKLSRLSFFCSFMLFPSLS